MLRMRQEEKDKITHHCIRECPNEACGILAGRSGTVEEVYEMTNAEKSPSEFFMDPKEQLAAMKRMRNKGLEMVGIYHSHVASQAYPSRHDIELAFYPDASYLIVSLADRQRPGLRSFKIREGTVEEEEVKVL